MSYITSLHANAVSISISFPFFAASGSKVTARRPPPTPAQLAVWVNPG